MRTRLDVRAEIVKMASLLEVAPEQLGYLETVPHQDLRTFRERATDRLFSADADRLRRVATASGLVPPRLAATIGQRVFGPLLAARVAGLISPDRAVSMAKHLETSFLADVSIALDPRHASDVIARMPADLVVEVARELVRRQEYVTMGRFVAYVSDATIQAATEVIDNAGLLEIGFVLEDKDRLDHVVSVLPEDRLAGVITAAAEHDLWPEALSLLQHVSEERSAELADLTASMDDEVVTSLIGAGHDEDLWDTLLPVTALMSADSRRRFASLPIVSEDAVLRRIVATTVEADLWRDLLPFVTVLPEEAQERIAHLAADLDRSILERAVTEADEHGLWPALTTLFSQMPSDVRAEVAQLATDAYERGADAP